MIRHRSSCIDIQKVSASYGKEEVLSHIDWQVHPGRLAAIIGPNGGGKTTLLKLLIGKLKPIQGEVKIMGCSPVKMRKYISYLPQNDTIDWQFPLSVLDIVVQGRLSRIPWWKRIGPPDIKAAYEALKKVELIDSANEPISFLSGGQRQRALIARALAQDARLILLDEPATALDAPAQHDLLQILELLKEEGRTVVATTHDLNCLTDKFDLILCLNKTVISRGTPNEALRQDVLFNLFGRHIPLLTPEGEVTMIEHNRNPN